MATIEKIPCRQCKAPILASTYSKNKGLCVPCCRKIKKMSFFDNFFYMQMTIFIFIILFFPSCFFAVVEGGIVPSICFMLFQVKYEYIGYKWILNIHFLFYLVVYYFISINLINIIKRIKDSEWRNKFYILLLFIILMISLFPVFIIINKEYHSSDFINVIELLRYL